MSRDLMRHEAAHALGALVSGATFAIIEEDGQHWKTTPIWPEGAQPDELATMTGYLAGPICYPANASGEDRLLMQVIRSQKPDLFEQIRVISTEAVRPAIEGISTEKLDRWILRIEAGERVTIRRKDGN